MQVRGEAYWRRDPIIYGILYGVELNGSKEVNQIITGIELVLPADSLPRQRASRQNNFFLERTPV